jgi:hypothetical protein
MRDSPYIYPRPVSVFNFTLAPILWPQFYDGAGPGKRIHVYGSGVAAYRYFS